MSASRTEILRLIRRLHEAQAIPRFRADPQPVLHAIDVARARGPRRVEPAARLRPSAAPAADATPRATRCAEIHEAIQKLARRLDQMEESLTRLGEPATRRRSSVPPPPSDNGYTFSGILRESLMSETLQLVSRNTMTGIFGVETDLGTYKLFVREGEIHHGDGPGVSGESAVFAAIAVQDGRFWFLETTDIPEERTVHGNTQFLVLEALRRIDEQQGGG